jgi:hypothetical protein
MRWLVDIATTYGGERLPVEAAACMMNSYDPTGLGERKFRLLSSRISRTSTPSQMNFPLIETYEIPDSGESGGEEIREEVRRVG